MAETNQRRHNTHARKHCNIYKQVKFCIPIDSFRKQQTMYCCKREFLPVLRAILVSLCHSVWCVCVCVMSIHICLRTRTGALHLVDCGWHDIQECAVENWIYGFKYFILMIETKAKREKDAFCIDCDHCEVTDGWLQLCCLFILINKLMRRRIWWQLKRFCSVWDNIVINRSFFYFVSFLSLAVITTNDQFKFFSYLDYRKCVFVCTTVTLFSILCGSWNTYW